MRFAISLLNFRPGHIGGAETYIRGIVGALPLVLPPEDSASLILRRDNRNAIECDKAQTLVLPRGDRGVILQRLMEAFTPYHDSTARRALLSASPDAVLFPQQSMYPKRIAVPVAVVVHDLSNILRPEGLSRLERAYRARSYGHALRRANRLVAISQYHRDVLMERCGVPPERVAVIPHGVPDRDVDSYEPLNPVGRPFLFYPAATWKHKGHDALLRSFACLRQREGFDRVLVLAGARTPYWDELRALVAELGIADAVIHLGLLPFDDVCRMYRAASAVVFPSRTEGYGLPVVEAAHFGAKVITSRLPVFHELGVPPEWQIDFDDPEALVVALEREGPTVLSSPPWRWSDAARATLQVLRDCAEEPGSHGG